LKAKLVKDDLVLAKLRAICTTLPGTTEKQSWGHPNFCVNKKIYSGYENYKGEWFIFFRVEKDHQSLFLKDPRFVSTPYIGKNGWVSLRVEGRLRWSEIRGLVKESYRLVKGE